MLEYGVFQVGPLDISFEMTIILIYVLCTLPSLHPPNVVKNHIPSKSDEMFNQPVVTVTMQIIHVPPM